MSFYYAPFFISLIFLILIDLHKWRRKERVVINKPSPVTTLNVPQTPANAWICVSNNQMQKNVHT